MKRVIYVLTLAMIFAVMVSPAVLAETEAPTGVKNDGTSTVHSDEPIGTQAGVHSLLGTIVDAVEDLLGEDDPNLDPPIGDIHPPDWDEPTEDPDGDDDGWSDIK